MVTEKDIKNNESRATFAIRLLKKIERERENKQLDILELGTGDGELFSRLLDLKYNLYCIDVKIPKALKKYRIKKHDLNKGLPFEDNSFDVVIGLEVLEHLFNPFEMMKEIKRVLKSGGSAIISMPNTDSVFSRIGQIYEKRFDQLDPYWHHYQPSVKSIINLVNTSLNVKEKIFISTFRRLSWLNWILDILVKINTEKFSGDFMVLARKD